MCRGEACDSAACSDRKQELGNPISLIREVLEISQCYGPFALDHHLSSTMRLTVLLLGCAMCEERTCAAERRVFVQFPYFITLSGDFMRIRVCQAKIVSCPLSTIPCQTSRIVWNEDSHAQEPGLGNGIPKYVGTNASVVVAVAKLAAV